MTTDRIEFIGAPGSPYTRKMLATLRYRRIPHNMLWGGHTNPPKGYPEPKVKLLPTFYFPNADGALEAVVDSTPITRRLEAEHDGRSVIPSDPELAFYNDLIEDYADEWLTKAMFHYRWYHEPDRKNAGPILMYWSVNTAPPAEAQKMIDYFTKRQFDRLYVVGSNDVTAETIEDSYKRFLDLFDALLQVKGFTLGARPSSADFAIYGQLTQLGWIEPTSAKIMSERTPRVRAWLDLIDDLSGLEPAEEDWFTPDEAREALGPLLAEIGRVYAPFLLANAEAAGAGQDNWEAEIDGRAWTQPTFPYQVKCLAALRDAHAGLPGNLKPPVNEALHAAGLDALVSG
ncbi:MAG: glutathione S-transferase family protein [Pseudomonadota bacterium]